MTVTFHARSTLGFFAPDPRRLTQRTAAQQTTLAAGITGHWTGEGGTLYHPDPSERLRAIQRYHVRTLGYGDIAYEGAFDADANVFGLRDNRYVGAHAKSTDNIANIFTNGVVFLEDRRGWTAGALDAWNFCRGLFLLAHHRPAALWAHEWWAGHAGGTPTECPGSALRDVIRTSGGKV